MEAFSDHILLLDDRFNTNDFPERFGNEIYLSSVSQPFHYDYVSPFSIKYVRHGSEHYALDRGTVAVKANQALIINQGQRVAVMRDLPGEANAGMSIFLDPAIVADVMGSISVRNVVPDFQSFAKHKTPIFYDRKITEDETFLLFLGGTYERLLKNRSVDTADYYQICERLLQFQFRLQNRVDTIDKAKRSTRVEIFDRVKVARDYLHDMHASKFNLDAVARECSLSRYFLIRCFKSIYHTTPQRYHQALRMQKAKELLLSRETVNEVAEVLGYSDLSSFSRDFRKAMHASPSAYRKSHSRSIP